jgi:uncharacterized protein DUF6542
VSNPYASSGESWASGGSTSGGDGWGPATSVRAGDRAAPRTAQPARPHGEQREHDPWNPAGPLPTGDQRATRRADRGIERQIDRMRRPTRGATAVGRPYERGLRWWAALLILCVIAVIGGVIDTIGSIQVRGGFNIGIVVASIVAILLVKRSHMFPIVIAPPIVYSVAAVFQLYIRSNGGHDKKVVFDAAANYLVYGFPAIAAATAAVLIIAGIRLITRK